MNQIEASVGQTMSGRYKASIVNPLGEVVWEQPDFTKNLILNQGMDAIYSSASVALFTYGICGEGFRPNNFNGGDSFITQSGTTVHLGVGGSGITSFQSASSNYAAILQVGDMIKYSNNSESKVTSVTDATHAEVTPSYTIPLSDSQSFVIWKTSQVGLESETKRTVSYLTGTGNCGSTTAANVVTNRRTFEFTSESVQKTYTELGVGWSSTGSNQVFSRILLPSPIIVDATFSLRAIYDLSVTYTPATASALTASITGWHTGSGTTYGFQQIQTMDTAIVQTNGGVTTQIGGGSLEPAAITSGFQIWVSPSSASLLTIGNSQNRSTNAGYFSPSAGPMSRTSLTSGTWQVDKTAVLSVSLGNRTDLRSIGFGGLNNGSSIFPPGSNGGQAFCILFDDQQAKTSSQTLSLTFRFTWGRTLA